MLTTIACLLSMTTGGDLPRGELVLIFPTDRVLSNMPSSLDEGVDCGCAASATNGAQYTLFDSSTPANIAATTSQHKWSTPPADGRCSFVSGVDCNELVEGDSGECSGTFQCILSVTQYLTGPNWVGWAAKHSGQNGTLTYTGVPANDFVTIQDPVLELCNRFGPHTEAAGFYFGHGVQNPNNTTKDGEVSAVLTCAECVGTQPPQ